MRAEPTRHTLNAWFCQRCGVLSYAPIMRTLLPFVLRYQLLVNRRPEWHATSCGLHPSQFPFRQSTRNTVSRYQLIRLTTSPYWHRGLTRRGPETKQSLMPMTYCPWHAEKHRASRRKLMPDRLPIRQSPFGQCGEPNPTQPQCDPSHGRTADRSPAVPEQEPEATPLRTSRLARAQRRPSCTRSYRVAYLRALGH